MRRLIFGVVLTMVLTAGVVFADSTVAILDELGSLVGVIHGELVPSMCDPYDGAATISDSVITCVNGYTLVQQ